MMQFKFKTISTADGSANIKSFPNSSNLKSDFGTQNAQQIELIAAVHGPAPISGRLQEGEEATIKVTVDTLNTPPRSFGANNEPRLFAIAFNGAIAALLDAAIPLRSVPVAVTDGTSTVVFEYHTQLTCKEMSDEFDQSPLEETSSTLLFSELFGPDSAETLRILEKESQDMFNNLKNALETACVDN